MRYRELQNDLKPAIPYIFLYDNTGGQTINGSFLTWDTTKIKTQHFQYESDTNRVELKTNSTGLFEVYFEVSLTAGAAAVASFDVYKNGTYVDGSRTYISVIYSQGAYNQSGVVRFPLYLEEGDYIQILGTAFVGAPTIVADTCRLIIKWIPMAGWDNSMAGRLDYKYGVQR